MTKLVNIALLAFFFFCSLAVCSANPVNVNSAALDSSDILSEHATVNLAQGESAADASLPSSTEHNQQPESSTPSSSSIGNQQEHGEAIQVYVIDTSPLPEPLANLIHRIHRLQYGQTAVTYLHRVSGGLIPNAQFVVGPQAPVLEAAETVVAPLSRSARSVEERKLGLLAGKKLLKGLILKKVALKAGKVAAVAALLPVKLAVKGALVGGLIAKPFLLKSALVGAKVAKVGALVLGKPLLAAGGLAAAGGLVKAGLVKAAVPKVVLAATKGAVVG